MWWKEGEDAVAAYGIGTRIEQMIMLLTVGLNISTLSITSFNYGAKQYARVRQVYHLCLLYGISMMVLGSLLLRFSAEFWIGLFSDSPEVVIQGVHFHNLWYYIAGSSKNNPITNINS